MTTTQRTAVTVAAVAAASVAAAAITRARRDAATACGRGEHDGCPSGMCGTEFAAAAPVALAARPAKR
jgi:hypothetical protein